MKQVERIAFIGSHTPRRCGIATFTHDLHRAVSSARPSLETTVVAMTDCGRKYDYPPTVGYQIREDVVDDYTRAADYINGGGFDAVSLQHEFGIFGGEQGSHIIPLLTRLEMPIVTTLHTVLSEPSPAQRDVLNRVIDLSSRLVVMSEKGRGFLRSVHGVPSRKIDIIPHGIPDCPFQESEPAKGKLGFAGRRTILTFGLLSPSKGIETMLEAMTGIVRACPDALYVVLGATHPHLVRDAGETYRESLAARVEALGLQNHVVFIDQFVDTPTLLEYISMCDVYVTPYLNVAQMTSGTLSYSYGLGKAVVSTPYWHAEELLDDGRGVLVPFGDANAMGSQIADLLTNSPRRQALRRRAYEDSRSMTWAQTGKRYLASLQEARAHTELASGARAARRETTRNARPLPEVQTGHLMSMCDDTGMLQHAIFSIGDRLHGYCIDDNARALLLASVFARSDEPVLPEALTARFAAFVQHAWNPDNQRFRNFMSFDRRWLEDKGSEDSHGRTLWALAECARHDNVPSRRRWAAALFREALPVVEGFKSPRAWAFTLLALDAYANAAGSDLLALRLRAVLAGRLMRILDTNEKGDWIWFETTLAYDNARLPQALILTGLTAREPAYVEQGLRTLRWLMQHQTSPSGCFRPVGSDSFGRQHSVPEPFDQQPLESAATISACLAAARADKGGNWPAAAMKAFEWFVGVNDLALPLIDPVSGGCADGLHPDRRNENMGAESTLSYLLGLMEMRAFQRTAQAQPGKILAMPRAADSEGLMSLRRAAAGGNIDAIQIPEPTRSSPSSRSLSGRRPAV